MRPSRSHRSGWTVGLSWPAASYQQRLVGHMACSRFGSNCWRMASQQVGCFLAQVLGGSMWDSPGDQAWLH